MACWAQLRGILGAGAVVGLFYTLMLLAALVAVASERPGDLGPTIRPESLEPQWVEIDGELYGAKPSQLGPIGGGESYQNTISGGDYRVNSGAALIEALEQAQAGEVVFVEPDAQIDLTVRVYVEELVLEIPEGVTLASSRGVEGSPGAIIYSDTFDTRPLIRATGADVRVTGLRLRGPDPQRRMEHHRRSFGTEERGRRFYYAFPTSQGISTSHDRLEVDNCELWGWSHSAVSLRAGTGHHVHHNHIHHNQRHGLGYGVTHNRATSLIEYNLFDYNRHAIAGTGRPTSGYEARHNIVLHHANSHHFDMHGGRDRGDGTDVAGTWMKVHHNTFLGDHVAAVVIRGVPEEKADIRRNWFYHQQPGERVVRSDGRTDVENNVYGPEPSEPGDVK